ncbi:MAG: DUF4157 domain-containing protein [Xenococcaceae cyanobacterium MO_234.B1]|nr:DUF4157 domain-containing protein [Xenococcaceae cyanobacterium MO_234.B1]
MEAAAVAKTEEKKKGAHTASEPLAEPMVAREVEAGAKAGMPLFLQRAARSPAPLLVQQQVDEEEEANSEARPEEELEKAKIQTKLTVGELNDVYEQEADSVADRVMRQPDSTDEEKEDIAPSSLNISRLQRKCKMCEAEEEPEEDEQTLQRKGESSSFIPGQALSTKIQATEGGKHLSNSVRDRIEPVLGTDLSHVRVHDDLSANQAAKSLHARAFTHQNHIWLGTNESPSDTELMAHEATHVIQQTANNPGAYFNGTSKKTEQSQNLQILNKKQTLSTSGNVIQRWEGEEVCREGEDWYEPEETLQCIDPNAASPTSTTPTWTSPPRGISSADGLRIIALPENHPEIRGRTISYNTGVQSRHYRAEGSWYHRHAGPWEVIKPNRTRENRRSEGSIEVDLNQTGQWIIRVRVEVNQQGNYDLEYRHDVIDPGDLAARNLSQLTKVDFLNFRARLEMERLRLSRYSAWASINQSRTRPYITCDKPNPASVTNDPDRVYQNYRVHPSRNANRFRWYVRANNSERRTPISYRRAGFGEVAGGNPNARSDITFHRVEIDGEPAWVRSGYRSETSTVFTFIVSVPDTYTIICEELGNDGRPTGRTARYVQVVLPAQEFQRLEGIRRHIRRVDEEITKIQEGSEVPLKAAYVNSESGESMTLSLYLGRSQTNESTFTLLDLTPGVPKVEYSGSSVDAALNEFSSGNSYPTGVIALEVPRNEAGINPLSRRFDTTGSSTWAAWSSGIGWASLGLAAVGIVAALIPGGQVVAGWCFIAAAGAGAASGGLSLYDRLQQAEVDATGVAIDVLGIASSILGGASAFRAARHGASVALGTRTGRYLLWAGFSTDVSSGVLLTVQGFEQIDRILESADLSRGEKIGAIVRILANLALQGGLLMLSVRDLRQIKTRLSGQLGNEAVDQLSNDVVHTLNLLNDDALQSLRNATAEQLENVAGLIRVNRDVANELIRVFGQFHNTPLQTQILNQYFELIISDVNKGTSLLRSFGTFDTFNNFRNIFQAIEHSDISRMRSVFSETFLNSLSDNMRRRYQQLLEDTMRGNLGPSGPSFSERLEVLSRIHSLRGELSQRLSQQANAQINLGQRNLMTGDFQIRLPNGESIAESMLSVSGRDTSNRLIDDLGNSIQNRTITPEIDRSNQRFTPSEGRAFHDSERKFLEYIVRRMQDVSQIPINRGQSYIGQGFSGRIVIQSEMQPCTSCLDVIERQFRDMFGNDISLNFIYGVNYP